MADPTELEVQTQIGLAVKIIDRIYKFGSQDATNILGMIDALVANPIEGDFSDQVLEGTAQIRDQFSGLIRLGRAMIDPLLRTYGQVLNFPERDAPSILERLKQEFFDNTKTVLERNFTYGSPTADGGNAGTGQFNRLNVDRFGFFLEAQFPDGKIAKVVRDASQGANKHEESWELRGETLKRDVFARGDGGSGDLVEIKSLSGVDSEAYLVNPSFHLFAGTLAAPTTINGWTPTTSIGNFEVVEGAANIYRNYLSEGDTPRSLKIKAADKLSQAFTVRGATFSELDPYYCQIAVNKDPGTGSGGSIVLRLGSNSTTLALASFAAGWNVVRIAIGQDNWFRSWNEEAPDLEIEWTSFSSGFLLVDDVILSPYRVFDGSYYAPVGGETPWLFEDFWTWTDTEVGSILQFWFWMLYNVYLPSTAAAPSWAEPT